MRRTVLVVLLALGTMSTLVPAGVAGATDTSPTSAGYVAQFGEQAVTADGSVNVPRAKCLNSQGLDGYLTTTFAVVGPSGEGYEQISTTCPHGMPVYEASITDALGATVSEAVSPGDTVTFAASVSSTSASYTLTDSATGPISLLGPGFGVTGVQALQEGQVGPFPKFALLKFGPISVNGAPWDRFDPTGYNEVEGQTVQLKVGRLARDGGFHVTYVSQG